MLDHAVRSDPRFPPTRHSELLAAIVAKNRWTIGLEVGVLKGRTLFHLLDQCPDLRMIGVDAWEYRDPSDEDGAEHYRSHDLGVCAREVKLRATRYHTRCRILHMDHRHAAIYVPDGSLDFVFCDADHTEQGTREAIETWRPKVRAGGALLGHDWNWPSVRRALDSCLPGWQGLPESVWRWNDV